MHELRRASIDCWLKRRILGEETGDRCVSLHVDTEALLLLTDDDSDSGYGTDDSDEEGPPYIDCHPQ